LAWCGDEGKKTLKNNTKKCEPVEIFAVFCFVSKLGSEKQGKKGERRRKLQMPISKFPFKTNEFVFILLSSTIFNALSLVMCKKQMNNLTTIAF
jgi:hypothetical protein